MADLNQNLIPSDAPMGTQGQVTPLVFDWQNESGVISAAKIKNLSFNQANGGTITLGGQNNGNGVMHVLDSSGGTIITADNSGIVVNSGNIQVKDMSGTTILDSRGLVSINNFANLGTVTGAISQDITGTTATDITGASLSLTLSRNTIILLLADTRSFGKQASGTTDWDATYKINFNIDGTQLAGAIIEEASKSGVDKEGVTHIASSSMHNIMQLAGGTHTLKLQSNLTNSTGNGQAVIYNYNMSYLILGS